MPGGGLLFACSLGRGGDGYFTYMLCFGRAMTRITIGSKNSSGSL